MADTIVFDLETKKAFSEIKNRNDLHLLEVSVLCAYSYEKDKFYAFEEKDLDKFETMIQSAGLVIGFNIKGFDLPVLKPYVSLNLSALPVLDLMDEVVRGAGFRISLDNLCQTTLGAKKSAHGLDAIRWYREGKIDEIKKYCVDDVKLTRDLYEFGKKNSYVSFFSRDAMDKVAIPVVWTEKKETSAFQILNEALSKKKSVEIDYVTRSSDSNDNARKTRLVDLYKLDNNVFEGYCHLRKGLRVFKVDRVLSAKLTDLNYNTEEELQHKLL
jgi:hypothetical protein